MAWLLVIGFAGIPALSRVNDRLSATDQIGGVKLTKTVERPHEKRAAAGLVTVAPVVPVGRLATVERLAPRLTPPAALRAAAPPALRAPPAC